MARLRQSRPCSLLRFSYFSLIYHVLFCYVVDTWWFKRKQMKMLRHWCCVKSSLHRGFSLFVFLALTLLLLSFLKTTKEKLKTKSNESIAEKNNNCWIGRYKSTDSNNETSGELFFSIYWIATTSEYRYVVLHVWCQMHVTRSI